MSTSRKSNSATRAKAAPPAKASGTDSCQNFDPEFPVFPEYYDPGLSDSRLPLSPEEQDFRSFIKSRLPQIKASQALRERIRMAVENSLR